MSEQLTNDREALRDVVRQKYGEVAVSILNSRDGGCCGSGGSCCGAAKEDDPITSKLYSEQEAREVPDEAFLASLGCGNPTALMQLNKGETVLDLGSGGGIDVLLSANRVGPRGFVYGLDMTDEMLALAESNRTKMGAVNVKFLKGVIEEIPLPEQAVDVVISNCVINLSIDKGQVLREAFRVLKPGGRFAVSDVVVRGKMDEALRADREAYVGCVAGALEVDEYRRLLTEAGFEDVEIQPTRVYDFGDSGKDTGEVMSAFVRATKPSIS